MRKSRRRGGRKRRPQASLAYAVAIVSSFILSGMSTLAVVGALESTEKINKEEDFNAQRVNQHGSDEDKLRSKNQYLLLKGQSELPQSRRREDRQLVTNKEKKMKTGLRTARKRVKMKTVSAPVNRPQTSAAYTMVTKTAGQTTRTKMKNPFKQQMLRARLEKRAEKRKSSNPGGQENYISPATTFLGNLELKLHQQVESGRGKPDWLERRSGKPSGGWNNNRWSDSRRPSGGKPGGWKPDGWESDRWKQVGNKPRNRWFDGERTDNRWSGNNNWSNSCRCTYIDPDPGEAGGSLWSWTGSSWSWGGKIKVCTCEPTYKPTFHPTYYPTDDPTYYPTRSPTVEPTLFPTLSPIRDPTFYPTLSPTAPDPTLSPTLYPTLSPTLPDPTLYPTMSPTLSPTISPTEYPTLSPTLSPTIEPTRQPTMTPTISPTAEPTTSPTVTPTENPTFSPTETPTSSPTFSPTTSPTESPTFEPTIL